MNEQQENGLAIAAIASIVVDVLKEGNGSGYDIPKEYLDNPSLLEDSVIRSIGENMHKCHQGGL